MNKKFCSLAVFFSLFLFVTGYATAQTPAELRFGTWVTGNLTTGEEIWYSIRSTGSGLVTVETRGNIDTYLEAFDASRNKIAEDDDGGEDANARLEIFAEPGITYLFKLRGYDSDVSGPFRIIASFEEVPFDTAQNTERSRAVLLNHDQPVSIFFRSPNESRWYRYNLPRSQNLLIVQTKGSLDTLLYLYDAQGKLLVSDDDSGEGNNALISRRLATGFVFIEVRTHSGETGGTTLEAENWYRD